MLKYLWYKCPSFPKLCGIPSAHAYEIYLKLCCFFSKSTFFDNVVQECHQRVKEFGSRTGPTECRAWSGSKLFNEKLQQMTPVGTVSHFSYAPLFQGPYFLTKMLESNILYDNLFIDSISVWWHRKNIGITRANHSATSKAILTKMTKTQVQPERLYFLFLFCARHYPWWSLWQKNTIINYFIQVKPLFLVVELINSVTFWRNARFDVILTSVTTIKQGFLRKLFCYESLVDIEVSKH